MDYQQYRRADGLLFVVDPDGQVYELREVDLDPALIARASDHGYLTRLDDVSVPPFESRPSPQTPRRRWGGSPLRVVP